MSDTYHVDLDRETSPNPLGDPDGGRLVGPLEVDQWWQRELQLREQARPLVDALIEQVGAQAVIDALVERGVLVEKDRWEDLW